MSANVNRLFADPNSLISKFGYDSRSNQTLAIDPKGNSTVAVFDGASRQTQVQQHLRQRGDGQAPPAANQTLLPYGGGSITTNSVYDGNGRLTQLIDDNGNPTNYEFDTLDRQTKMIFRDGATRTRASNTASNVVAYTDENGSVFSNTFDALGRKIQCDISLASGVIGTDQQKFEFDGVSRLTFARDSISSAHADVNLRYDSLSRVLEDSQTFGGNTRNVTHEEFESYPATQLAYPDGRQTTNEYDDLYRRTEVKETSGGASIGAWEFFGPGRVAELTLGNGLICSHLNNARTHSAVQETVANPAWGGIDSDRLGYDGAGRMITKRYLSGGINGGTHAYDDPTSVVGQTTEYDKASNKFFERSLQAESRSSLYEPRSADSAAEGGYDSLDRLRQYQRGVLSDGSGGNPAPAGGSVITPISLPGTDEDRTYDLDGLGNWKRTRFDPVGGSDTTEIRQHNGLNQITKIDSTPFSYDENGNLLDDGTRSYEWDALNRLKNVYKTPSTPVLIGEYTYDALNRRIRKVVSNGGLSGTIPNGTTDFLYNSRWQCLEERNGSNAATKQYVWGVYIDELLQMKYDLTGTPKDSYLLTDTLYTARTLTDDTGAILEAYDTDAYGNTLIYSAAGTGGNWWADDAVIAGSPLNQHIFTSRLYDMESSLYCIRNRFVVPTYGRFLSRDPVGYVSFSMNLFGYVDNRPERTLDPLGLVGEELSRSSRWVELNTIVQTRFRLVQQWYELSGLDCYLHKEYARDDRPKVEQELVERIVRTNPSHAVWQERISNLQDLRTAAYESYENYSETSGALTGIGLGVGVIGAALIPAHAVPVVGTAIGTIGSITTGIGAGIALVGSVVSVAGDRLIRNAKQYTSEIEKALREFVPETIEDERAIRRRTLVGKWAEKSRHIDKAQVPFWNCILNGNERQVEKECD